MDPYRTEDLKSVQEERDAAKRQLDDLTKTIDRRVWRYVGAFILVMMAGIVFNTALVWLTLRKPVVEVACNCSVTKEAMSQLHDAVDGIVEEARLAQDLAEEAIRERDACRNSPLTVRKKTPPQQATLKCTRADGATLIYAGGPPYQCCEVAPGTLYWMKDCKTPVAPSPFPMLSTTSGIGTSGSSALTITRGIGTARSASAGAVRK